MKFIAEIDDLPRKDLLNSQGKTLANNLKNLHLSGIEDARIGKPLKMTLEADLEAEAHEKVEPACQELLANIILETYSFSVKPA